jgi:hypothetical protein
VTHTIYTNVCGHFKYANPVNRYGLITIDREQLHLGDKHLRELMMLAKGQDVKVPLACLNGVERMFPGQPLIFQMRVEKGKAFVTRPVTVVGELLSAMEIDFDKCQERPRHSDDILFGQAVIVTRINVGNKGGTSAFASPPTWPKSPRHGKGYDAFIPAPVLDTFGVLSLEEHHPFPEPVDIWLAAPKGPRVLPRGLADHLFPSRPARPSAGPRTINSAKNTPGSSG